MAYKSRTESKELRVMKSLFYRMDLSEKDKQYYYNLKKGYEGEVLFDSLTEMLQCECLILNDLRLKVNNTTFQIDTVILSELIYLFEVKNFEGDYYYDGDKFYQKPKIDRNNPLHQLNRAETLFRQLLYNLKFNAPIDGSVVFINPEFTLYQAPLNKPQILPTQVHRYLRKLNETPSKLNVKHKWLAEKLASLHNDNYPFTELPAYQYEHLRKGIFCRVCGSLSISLDGQKCVCEDCSHTESVESAVMRLVNEFKLLFPERKITTKAIHEWCGEVNCRRSINRILDKHFKLVGFGKGAHYIDKEKS
jgi:hypothetical protein